MPLVAVQSTTSRHTLHCLSSVARRIFESPCCSRISGALMLTDGYCNSVQTSLPLVQCTSSQYHFQLDELQHIFHCMSGHDCLTRRLQPVNLLHPRPNTLISQPILSKTSKISKFMIVAHNTFHTNITIGCYRSSASACSSASILFNISPAASAASSLFPSCARSCWSGMTGKLS